MIYSFNAKYFFTSISLIDSIFIGASFIVTASFREDIARTCNRQKIIPYMPGCGTLTKIGIAEEWGCDIVKLFPGSVYGPDFVKIVMALQPWTQIMPKGGVVVTSEENRKGWFDAGRSGMCGYRI